MLYVFGGRNRRSGPVDTVEMLDTWHGSWVPCPPMPRRRAGSAATPLPDCRLLVVGGYDERGIVAGLLAHCDVYNPFTECWEKRGAAPLQRARWGHGCALLGGRVYAVGGCSLKADARPQEAFMETLRSCEVYDPGVDRWEVCSPLNVPRSGSRVIALGERHIAAVGGCDDVFGRAETQATIEVYSVTTGCWALLEAQLTVPRTSAAVAALDCRRFLVAGGAPSQASVELCCLPLPPEHGERKGARDEAPAFGGRAVEDMPEARMGCQAAVLSLPTPQHGLSSRARGRRCLLVVGGERCDQTGAFQPLPRVRQLSSIAAYDLEDGAWREASAVPAMAVPRTTMAVCPGLGRVGPARLR
mmetsp:Transcript_114692/g.348928  ORF Transcript_114692/g.348928 Transcript_114692/m.348928 type:complete len:358 (-) Transcript_114692:272-1345(-)